MNARFLLAALAMLAAVLLLPQAQAAFNDSMLGYYSFNANWNVDAYTTGAGYNFSSTAGSIGATNCKFQSCLVLDGTQGVGTNNLSAAMTNSLTAGTIAFFLNTDTGTVQYNVFSKGAAVDRSQVRTDGTAGTTYFQTNGGTTSTAISESTASTFLLVYTWNSTERAIWRNTTKIASSAGTYSFSASGNLGFGQNQVNVNERLAGSIDELYIFSRVLNSTEITCMFNQNYTTILTNATCGGTPAPPVSANFSVTARDNYTLASLTNLSVWMTNGSTNLSFTSELGQVNTSILQNSTTLWDVTVGSNQSGGYFNTTYASYNVSSNLVADLNKFFRLINISYAGNVTYNSTHSYVRQLNYTLNYTCPSFYNATLTRYVNGSVQNIASASCTNATATTSFNYTHAEEGQYNFTVLFNASYEPGSNNDFVTNRTFYSDLNNPSVAALSIAIPEGFQNPTGNVSMRCTDNVYPNLTYNMTFNSANKFFGNLTANTTQTNSSTIADGTNTLVGSCADPFGSTSSTVSQTIYAKVLALIDERENTAFDVANISRARVYYDDNSSYFQFNSPNSSVNFTSNLTANLRFELVYSDGTIITRYVDVELVESPVRVCANKEGVTHYEQLIISATQRPAVLKNVFSNCLVAADYTRFAYQDAFVLKAFSIASLYYLYTFDGTDQSLLASLDGSISAFINLDTIEFAEQQTSINALADALSFRSLSNSTVQIYYNNLRNDSTALNVTITRMDSGAVVFSTTSFTNPNEWTLYFDYSTLAPAVNSSVLFKIVLTKTTPSGTLTVTRFFNNEGESGLMNSKFAFTISFLLMFFGLTFTISRTTFSWFGLFIVLASIILLGFATPTWYTTLLMALEAIILIYIGVLMWNQNYPTVT